VKSAVWTTLGNRAKITAYFTAPVSSTVSVTWEQKSTTDGTWKDIPSTGYSTFLSNMDDKGVMTATIVIDKTKASDITVYRAQVQIAGFKETTSEVKLEAVGAEVSTVNPVFEKESVPFSAKITGPRKPSSVFFVHEESGKEVSVGLSGVSSSSPFQVTHNEQTVYSSSQGNYHFKIAFDTGLEHETSTVQLVVKKKCRPLTEPPNTKLEQADISNSNNYKITVTCSNDSYVLMDESLKEVTCDTSTGTYTRTSEPLLTPCLKTIEPSADS
jgi:hypothetical protein